MDKILQEQTNQKCSYLPQDGTAVQVAYISVIYFIDNVIYMAPKRPVITYNSIAHYNHHFGSKSHQLLLERPSSYFVMHTCTYCIFPGYKIYPEKNKFKGTALVARCLLNWGSTCNYNFKKVNIPVFLPAGQYVYVMVVRQNVYWAPPRSHMGLQLLGAQTNSLWHGCCHLYLPHASHCGE